MKKNLKLLGITTICLFLVAGCGNIATLENGEEAVVTFDGADGISANDLYEELKSIYGISTLITMIDKQIYEVEYADSLEDAMTYATSYLESAISYYGSEDDALYYMGCSTYDECVNLMYVSYLQNLAIEDYSLSLITEDQVEKYYEDEYYGDVTLSHILITSDASSTADDDEITEAEEAAEDTAKEIIALLKEADENGEDIEEYFAELALEYSDDSSTSSNGGSFGTINYIDLDSSYDELIDAAIELSDGEYSTSVIETELGFHVILKVESYDKEDVEDVTDVITQLLSDNALVSDAYLSLDALEYYREEYGFDITDDELYEEYVEYLKYLDEQIASYYSY